jgi:translocation protein SEC72
MSEIDIFNQYPLYIDPQTKSISLPQSSAYTPTQTATINKELEELNNLHRSFLSLEGPAGIPPPPLPVNPKRSAQITKLRDTGNAAYRKGNHEEAVRLYTYAIDMALSRPGWEPVTLAREELSGLFGNRAQAYMGLQAWPEGFTDAKSSVDSKPVGNVKAWWRVAKCLAEMSRYGEAKSFVIKGLEIEGRASEGGKELVALLEDVEAALKRGETAS